MVQRLTYRKRHSHEIQPISEDCEPFLWRSVVWTRLVPKDVEEAAAAGPELQIVLVGILFSFQQHYWFALDLLKNVQVQAIIGPEYSVQANFLIALGHKAQVPIITFSATSPALTSIRSPYFIRAALKDSSQVKAIDALEDVNARVPYRSVISPLATDDQIVVELLNLMTMQTRVFVIHMMSRLASRLFTRAKERGMMSKEYAWIVTNGITNELKLMDHFVIESMLGVIGVKPYVPKTKELDDFAIRYKKRVLKNNPRAHTPDFDIFGLWAYDAAIALAMAAEKASLRNPTYREANISRNSTDLEAFGISDSGLGLIQALSTTTFNGLAGDFRLVDGQLQEHPFEIINMVGPGDRVIGYWTKENGLTKELNSTSGTTPESKLASIIWPGDGSSPPKGWVIPTNSKKLRVGVPVKDGFTEFVPVTWNSDNSTKVEGYCIDVFEAVMASLPFGVPYEFIPFATTDCDMAGNYNDLAYQVFLGNFDAVAGDVTIVANRSEYVDFTLPYTESGVAMVVPFQDDKSKNAMVFTKPLTWELWLTSFCSFVFIGFLIWILEHRRNTDLKGTFWYQIGTIFLFAFSTVVFAHIQKLQPTVTDINVLIKNKDFVGYMEGSFIFELLKKKKFDESQLVEYNSMERLDELLSKGSGNGGISAAFHEIPYIKLFLNKYCPNYTMVESIHNTDGFGFVFFPKGSPLVPHVSRAILNVTEGQKMVEIERKWLGDIKMKCPDPDTLRSPKGLGIESFWVLFVVVGSFGVGAFVIYVIRFLYENWGIVRGSETTRNKIEKLLKEFHNNDHQTNNNQETINWENQLANLTRIVELVRRFHNNNQGINQEHEAANLNANQ
ncbi:hypothetical protein DH2020_005999 [Rehmannia glutinosa]|uniref:Glutamate receptor n=1 Tax=Rehmannia glutinosa TaxID=99300 RepID=A0ABR0XHM3_REHGL